MYIKRPSIVQVSRWFMLDDFLIIPETNRKIIGDK